MGPGIGISATFLRGAAFVSSEAVLEKCAAARPSAKIKNANVTTSQRGSLYQILQILSVTLFEKTPILRALQACDFDNDLVDSGNRLILFNF